MTILAYYKPLLTKYNLRLYSSKQANVMEKILLFIKKSLPKRFYSMFQAVILSNKHPCLNGKQQNQARKKSSHFKNEVA